MWRRHFIPAILMTLVLACPLWANTADFTVSIGNLDLSPGKIGYVDVSITGNQSLLQALGFDFRIQTSGATRLEFTDLQPTDYLSDLNYVFAGNSFAQTYPPVGVVSESIVPGDTYIGGDMTLNNLNLKIGDSKLFARLRVSANTVLPPEVGDLFSISLTPSSSTYFSDSSSNTFTYSANVGSVHIVPEPGTAVLLLIPALLVLVRGWRRR